MRRRAAAVATLAAFAAGAVGCALFAGLTDYTNGDAGAAAGDGGDAGSAQDSTCNPPGNLLTAEQSSFTNTSCSPWTPMPGQLKTSSTAFCGSPACQMCWNGTSGTMNLLTEMPVLAGETYQLTGWILGDRDSGPVTVFGGYILDVGGLYVGTSAGVVSNTSSTWQEVKAQLDVPDAGFTVANIFFPSSLIT